jgi:hypothetical protein
MITARATTTGPVKRREIDASGMVSILSFNHPTFRRSDAR